jgi:hypothetical protein
VACTFQKSQSKAKPERSTTDGIPLMSKANHRSDHHMIWNVRFRRRIQPVNSAQHSGARPHSVTAEADMAVLPSRYVAAHGKPAFEPVVRDEPAVR